jgi:glycosyltransferase involved in cell wall biosynthesis
MPESISVIFPVRNLQADLKSRVEGLLDFLCDLSRDVQLIAVDDFSEDATPEILDDLRRIFPQLRVVRNRQICGPSQAVESVLCLAEGDFIFLHPSYEAIDFEEVIQLWQLRKDQQLVVARAATRVRRIDQQLLQRLHDWGRRLEEHWPAPRAIVDGLQMMSREGVKSLSKVREVDADLEVTHQSHRRITGPKFVQGAPAIAVISKADSR